MSFGKEIVNSLLSAAKSAVRDTEAASQAKYNSGQLNTTILEPIPNYNQSIAEKSIQGKTNTIIIMGRDRPGSESGGKGAGAATHVGCIDIIAGLSGIMAREANAEGKEVLTNKSTELDAARIYISQRADIDSPEYFNLAEGGVGNLTNRSAIAIKADSVRIIGREGIKLVTSPDQFSGAAGLFIGDNIQGVDIIAGNDDSDLQPMVKGNDLKLLLDNMVQLVMDVQSSTAFNLEIIAYTIGCFIDPSGTAAKKLSALLKRLPIEVVNLSVQEINFAFHEMSCSNKNPFAQYDFRSKHNNVN